MPEYVNTPFCYTGSKFKLLPQLLPLFDYSKSQFIDLFCGGGSVYANVLDKYSFIWVNDKIKDLVEIHRRLIRHGQEFVEDVKFFCPAKDDQAAYVELRQQYNQENRPDILFALMLSCTNNMIRFNQKLQFNQTFGKRSFSDKTQEKITAFINHVAPYQHNLFFSSKSFEEIWPENVKDTFFFLDPPYNGAVNNDAGYNCFYGRDDDNLLFDKCVKINECGGTFALSSVYSEDKSLNSLVVNKLLDVGFNLKKLDFNYQKVSRNKQKIQMTEVVITNY